MHASEFIRLRLANQRLSHPTLRTPAQVVRWLGAAQAQEYAGAKWSLALRMDGVSHAEIEQAFNAGDILRTHVMRPTWHFVAPEDIRWMLELTAPRVHALNAYYYRSHGLDDPALIARSYDALGKALSGGNHLTRAELALALEQAGIREPGRFRLAYILHSAELDGLICSGPRRGNQFTYALLSERAPRAESLPREEALARLTLRFFTSHGPAMLKDFSWWSGLTMADARIGLEIVRNDLLVEEIPDAAVRAAAGDRATAASGGTRTYYRPAASPAVEPPSPHAFLLQPYDEYTVAYREHWPTFDPDHRQQLLEAAYYGIILIDGKVAGNWKRTVKGRQARIETALFRPISEAESAALEQAAHRFAAFHDLEAVML